MNEEKNVVNRIFVLCLMSLMLYGCGDNFMNDLLDPGWQQRAAEREKKIEAYFEQNPRLSKDIKNAILNRGIRLGMTKEQVLLSWENSYYRLIKINKTGGPWGVHEQWIYNSYNGPYLYFENGILTSWQD